MESGGNALRRRRLVERGSDRLAFVTGQAHSLPSDPSPDSQLCTADAPSPQLSEWQPSEGGISDGKFSHITRSRKSEPSGTVCEIEPTGEAHLGYHKEKGLSNEGELQKRKTSSAVPPNQSNQSDDAGWSMETLKENLNFTPHEITQAISATEYNRFLASIILAFLVVLSNWGLDIGGTITRVLVGTRPLRFLIITDITIVFTLLMENKDPNARGRPAGSILVSADSLGQMLEIGLLLQKALGALLMDCSVCAVIMICFL